MRRWLFRRVGLDGPFVVLLMAPPGSYGPPIMPAESVQLGSVQATLMSWRQQGLLVDWHDGLGAVTELRAFGVGRQELLAVAEGVAVSGRVPSSVGGLPLVESAVVGFFAANGASVGAGGTLQQDSVQYEVGSRSAELRVWRGEGSFGSVFADRVLSWDRWREVKVKGMRALIFERSGSVSVLVPVSSTVVVELVAEKVASGALVSAAAALRPAGTGEWARLVGRDLPGGDGGPYTTVQPR